MGGGEEIAVAGIKSNYQYLMNYSVDPSDELEGRKATAIEFENK